MHTMFVAYDIVGINHPAGGVATFIRHYSDLLRTAGDEVTLLYANPDKRAVDSAWRITYQNKGVHLIQLDSSDGVNLSEEVASHVQLADVVYFQDWHSHAFWTVQRRRFSVRRTPTCVMVVHGASAWLRAGMGGGALSVEDLKAEFAEGYSAQYCDFLVSPSRAMLSWVRSRGWKLPAEDRVQVLGLPLLPAVLTAGSADQASTFKRIVFFGRKEKHKGFELFVEALLLLAKQDPRCLYGIEEIVFLGAESLSGDLPTNRFGRSSDAIRLLQAATGKTTKTLKHLDSLTAQQYLAEHAADTLVVIPSLLDNFPYTAIETSLIPGLNLLCAYTGGLPEIVSKPNQLFEPYPESLAARLTEWLRQGPLPNGELSHYDFKVANLRWLKFHEAVRNSAARAKMHVSAPDTSEDSRPSSAMKPYCGMLTVCIHYTDQSQYLPQLLLSLEGQTCQDFHVVVVADGENDSQSSAVFNDARDKYAARGWIFLWQSGTTVAIRNGVAAGAKTDYLFFIDAADIATPTMVERLLQAICLSGDDCLAVPAYIFDGDSLPYDWQAQEILTDEKFDLPRVNNPLLEIMEAIRSPIRLIVRRTSFEAVNGYAADCPEALLDEDLYLRLTLAGCKVDDLPEYLYFARASEQPNTDSVEAANLVSRRLKVYDEQHDKQPASVQHGALTLAIRSLRAQVEAFRQAPRRSDGEAKESPSVQAGKLKVLMLLPYFPAPPRTGALTRFWEQIRFWGTFHDLTVVTFISPDEVEMFEYLLLPYTEDRVAVIYNKPRILERSDLPESIQFYTTYEMKSALQQIDTSRFDIAIIEQIFMAEYRSLLKTRTILTEHNIEFAIPGQISGLAQTQRIYGSPPTSTEFYAKQARLMKAYETRQWPHFSLRIAVSEKDKQEIDRHCRIGKTVLIENGTDTTRFIHDLNPQSKNILFMGALSYAPNIDAIHYFIDAIWPLLCQRDPETQLTIAGRTPPKQIMALADRPHIRLVADPADMVDVAKECSLSIVPLRVGSGTRIKILDSWAMGLPVVTTSLGCEGLPVDDGKQLLIRDNPAEFADAVLRLSTDQALWSKLQQAGYQLVKNNFSWDSLFEKMEDAVLQMLSTNR